MSFFKWLIGGLIGAAIGAAVWVAIVHFANYEVGYIAILVGFLAGLGVRMLAGDEVGVGPGTAAVGAAVLALLVSKYVLVSIAMAGLFNGDAVEVVESRFTPEQQGIMAIAGDIANEKSVAGEEIAWPEEEAVHEDDDPANDYPPEIWTEAKEQWEEMSSQEQGDFLQEQEKMQAEFMAGFENELKEQLFKQSFSPFDLLWFGLAALTAYRVGNGLNTDEEQAPPQEPEVEPSEPEPQVT